MGVYEGAEQALTDDWVRSRFIDPLIVAELEAISVGLADRIFLEVAPDSAPYPFIVFQCQSPPRDIRGVGISRVMVDTLYVVKAVGSVASYAPLVPVANAIDRAMTSAEGSAIYDGHVFSCIRSEQFSLVTREQGEIFRHLGGEFRIQAQG